MVLESSQSLMSPTQKNTLVSQQQSEIFIYSELADGCESQYSESDEEDGQPYFNDMTIPNTSDASNSYKEENCYKPAPNSHKNMLMNTADSRPSSLRNNDLYTENLLGARTSLNYDEERD